MDVTAQPEIPSDTKALVNKSTLQFAPHLKTSRVATSPRVTVGPHVTASTEIVDSPKTNASHQVTADCRATAGSPVLGPNATKGQVKGPHAAGTAASPQVTAPHRKMVKLSHESDSAKPTISRSAVLKSFGITSDTVAGHVKVEAPEEKENSHVKAENSAAADSVKIEDESPVEPPASAFTFTAPVNKSRDVGKVKPTTPLPTTASSSGSVEAARASAKKPISGSTTDKEGTLNNAFNSTSGNGSVENNAANGTTPKNHTLNGSSNGVAVDGVTIGVAHSNANDTNKALPKPVEVSHQGHSR